MAEASRLLPTNKVGNPQTNKKSPHLFCGEMLPRGAGAPAEAQFQPLIASVVLCGLLSC
jgi:hypothetical protein